MFFSPSSIKLNFCFTFAAEMCKKRSRSPAQRLVWLFSFWFQQLTATLQHFLESLFEQFRSLGIWVFLYFIFLVRLLQLYCWIFLRIFHPFTAQICMHIKWMPLEEHYCWAAQVSPIRMWKIEESCRMKEIQREKKTSIELNIHSADRIMWICFAFSAWWIEHEENLEYIRRKYHTQKRKREREQQEYS